MNIVFGTTEIEMALKQRELLYNKMSNRRNPDPEFKKYVALEYFLEMTDILPKMDAGERNGFCHELESFIGTEDARQNAGNLMFHRLKNIYRQYMTESE